MIWDNQHRLLMTHPPSKLVLVFFFKYFQVHTWLATWSTCMASRLKIKSIHYTNPSLKYTSKRLLLRYKNQAQLSKISFFNPKLSKFENNIGFLLWLPLKLPIWICVVYATNIIKLGYIQNIFYDINML